jgi:UDP-glucose 4-epimerase
MAHYLITGGCGFIGSHLADNLIADHHRVTILDNLSTGKRENAPKEARLIIGDARDSDIVEPLFSDIDGCFHLAAIASVEKSITHWRDSHSVNALATITLFQAASRQAKKTPIVYTSSAAVYGNNPVIPLSENADTTPLTAYGVDKLTCDMHARIGWDVHRIPTVGLRPFNVYGPRQDPHSPYSGVISIFTGRITNNRAITIYGTGEQLRDFVYVGDAVRVFQAAMENLREGHTLINICTGHGSSINNVAETLETLCQRTVTRIYAAPRKGDIAQSIGDPARLQNYLNLRLTTSIEEGLSYTIQRQREVA